MINSLFIYNTLTQKKELFVPQSSPKVNFYVCGVTVYDYCHIGHARAYVVFDTIRKFLIFQGFDVSYIQNFTDIDDKIIKRSNELNIPFQELTEKYIAAYFEDMDRLNIQRATNYPKATDYIHEMQNFIQILITKGNAYESGGDVWFAVETFREYGKLSKKIIEELQAGARIDINSCKRSPLDFVLWKGAKPDEPFWDSPWGKGRPGWHIECSTMVQQLLGNTIDIHGGGEDLIFPHHENEIAQSESAIGKPFVKTWIHNGFVTIQNEKMSKSLKNFFTIRDILSEYSGEVLRFFLLRVHYRSPLNFSQEGLDEAQKAWQRLQNTIKNIPHNPHLITPEIQEKLMNEESRFLSALADDFNFSEAIGVLFDLNRLINTCQCGTESLIRMANLLGILPKIKENEIVPQHIQSLLEQRTLAKKNKNFLLADSIRDQLLNLKYKIEDTPQGQRLKKID